MNRTHWLVDLITHRSRLILAIGLIAVLIVSAGAVFLEEDPEMEMFDEEPPEVQAQATVGEQFSAFDQNTTHLNIIVRNESGNVLDRDSLLASLTYQQQLRENDAVNQTLSTPGFLGIENFVAAIAIAAEETGLPPETLLSADLGDSSMDTEALPPINAQIDQLQSMSDEEVASIVEILLDGDRQHPVTTLAFELLPSGYEPGSPESTARLTVMTQATDGQVLSPPELSAEIRHAQVTAVDLADDVDRDEYLLVGQGLMVVEEEESTNDSLALVGPLALLFVIIALGVAYRDVLDIALGFIGILLVLLWTFGAMGWLGLDFNILMIATPVLLIGLSIDYCIHVIMRYREQRWGNGVADAPQDGDESSAPITSIRTAMNGGLVGLGPALVLVTVTAMIGFLSVLASGVPTLGHFGMATAAGIFGSLVVFGALVPALKVEVESLLATRDFDRSKRAFGTSGRLRDVLAAIAQVSYRRPMTILVVVLLLSSLGAVAGTQIDSEFSTDDYIAEDPPDWTHDLPEPFAPAEYQLRESLAYLFGHFQSPDQQVHYLIEGNLTDPETFTQVATIEQEAAGASATFIDARGEPAVSGPISEMNRVAAHNETFAARLGAADTTGDGVPDSELASLLDAFSRAAPERADQHLHRPADGGGGSMRVVQSVAVADDPTAIADEAQAIAAAGQGTASVTVTGDLIVNELIQRQLSTTLVQGLVVALAAVLLVLLGAFRYKRGSASLGFVTLIPVMLGLSWILGVMYLADIPFNFATAMIGSIAIGLGVDYAIHMTERFSHERALTDDTAAAIEATVVGTGGALLGSAVTTAGGFGVLGFSLVPVLQQFGFVIALAIVSAFAASVLALPSLLVLWARYVGAN